MDFVSNRNVRDRALSHSTNIYLVPYFSTTVSVKCYMPDLGLAYNGQRVRALFFTTIRHMQSDTHRLRT